MDERRLRWEVARLDRTNTILMRALTEIAGTSPFFAGERALVAIAMQALVDVASQGPPPEPSSSTASSTASTTRPGP